MWRATRGCENEGMWYVSVRTAGINRLAAAADAAAVDGFACNHGERMLSIIKLDHTDEDRNAARCRGKRQQRRARLHGLGL